MKFSMVRPVYVCCLFLHVLVGGAVADEAPNVLFIAIDDLRPALGCYGDPLAQSPNIDRLASEGRLFQGAYAQQAVCGPSRASLMTGRVPDAIRVWHNRHLFRDTLPDAVTLPQLFKQHGYHTVSIGKTFSGNPKEEDPASWSEPFVLRGEGWETYADPESVRGSGKGLPYEAADVPDEGYIEGKMTRMAVERLAQFKQAQQPFFLAVGYFKPHLPFNAPKRYWDMYDPAQFALQDQAEEVDGAPKLAYHTHRELGGYVGVPKDEDVTEAEALALRHGYYACVSYVDAQVGKLLEALEDLDLARNTLVVLWGDHGFALGEVSRWCKGTNFEVDTRVPLIVRVPGMSAPGVPTPSLVELVDIYPTLAEIAGLPAPNDLDGRSFAALLENPAALAREAVVSQFTRPWNAREPEVMGYSIRSQAYRYTRWIEWEEGAVLAEEFYDYTDEHSVETNGASSFEIRNVVDDPRQGHALERMRSMLDQRLKRPGPITAEEIAGGSKPIADAGLLREPLTHRKVFGVHDGTDLPPLRSGPVTSEGWLRPDRFYSRFATTLGQSGDSIPLFHGSPTVRASAQFVLVVGKPMESVRPEAVREGLAGFTIGIDVVDEALYASRAWVVARAPDGWAPLADRILPLEALEGAQVTTHFDGEIRIRYSVTDLEFAIEDLVSFISTTQPLAPGDLIYVGLPQKLNPLRPVLVPGAQIEGRLGDLLELSNGIRIDEEARGRTVPEAAAEPAGVERYVRLEWLDEAVYGRVEGDRIRVMAGDLSTGFQPTEATLLRSEGRLLPPVQPGKLFSITRNRPIEKPLEWEALVRELPERVRIKAADTITLTGGDILLPFGADNLDWEAELIIVIGRTARNISMESAMAHVFGYVAGNDVSENTWGGLAGKSHPTWGIVAEELVRGVDWREAVVTTHVNGVLVQQGALRTVRYPVEAIVAFLSRYFTLMPGDMIYAGTVARTDTSPEAMAAGDLVEVHISGVGRTQDTVRAIPLAPGLPRP